MGDDKKGIKLWDSHYDVDNVLLLGNVMIVTLFQIQNKKEVNNLAFIKKDGEWTTNLSKYENYENATKILNHPKVRLYTLLSG